MTWSAWALLCLPFAGAAVASFMVRPGRRGPRTVPAERHHWNVVAPTVYDWEKD